jgi:hypothetical protein
VKEERALKAISDTQVLYYSVIVVCRVFTVQFMADKADIDNGRIAQ